MSRRQAAATAGVGGGLVYGGGVVRHRAVEHALKDVPKADHPKVHALHMLKPVKGRKAWLVGTGLATVGAVPLGAGLVGVKRGGIGKADHTPLWREAASGTAQSLKDRGESLRTPVPVGVRATQLGIAAGSGTLGGRAVHLALKNRKVPGKAGLAALAGTVAATATIPATNRVVQRKHPEYVVTATGVKRQGKPIKRASSRSFTARPGAPRNLRVDVGKAVHPLPRPGMSAPRFAEVYSAQMKSRRPFRVPAEDLQALRWQPSHEPNVKVVADSIKRKKQRTPITLHESQGRPFISEGHHRQSALQDAGSDAYVQHGDGRSLREMKIKVLRIKRRKRYEELGLTPPGNLPMANGLLRRDVGKADSYLGSRTPYRTQRAAITGAGGVPVAGPFVQAHTAGSFAPPGKRRETAVRQFAMGPAAGNVAGAAAAYGAAHLANRNARFGDAAERGLQRKRELTASARHKTGVDRLKGPGHDSRVGRAAARLKTTSTEVAAPLRAHRLAKPFSTPKGAAAGALAFLGARAVTGGVGGQLAITRSQNEQRAYNTKHSIGKAQALLADRKQAQRKRRQANIGTAAGATSVAALAALGMRKERLANRIGIVGGAVGGSGALYGARVARGDAEVLERPRVAKSLVPGRGYKPATELTALERRLVRVGKPHRRLGPEVAAPADALPRYVGVKGLGRRRVIGYHSKDRFVVADDNGPNRIVHRNQVEYFKSFVGGQAKRAIDLSGAERAMVRARRAPRGPLLSRGTSPQDNPTNNLYHQFRQAEKVAEKGPKRNVLYAAGEFKDQEKHNLAAALPRKVKRPVVMHAAGHLPLNSGIGFPGAGSKRAAHVLIHANNPAVVTHEAAHALPRRNAMRIHGMDPMQSAREEGRADATAMRHHNLEGRTSTDYDTVPRIRRQADAGDERSKQAMGVMHNALAEERKKGLTSSSAGSLTSTYHTRAQSRAYSDVRARMGKPLGDTPVRFNKRDSVQITGSPHEHKALIRQYGDRGPLPAGLDRETKMKAYEARYVHAGGDKSEKWNHRANAAEGSRNAALATGTAGLAGLAALKHPRLARRMAKHPRLQHRLDATALTAGAAGGASELYGEYARHRRASYANSPGGVARSALTRMRSYTPDQVGKAAVHLGIPKVPTAFRRPMPKALFHGTSHDLKPGDVISPHNAIGGTDRGQGRAFATGDLRDAHSYARTRSGGTGGRVYRVEPVDHSDLTMENIGRRRRDGFTNVSSPSGFRVVGEAGAPRTSAAPYKPKPVSRFRPQASAGISLGG